MPAGRLFSVITPCFNGRAWLPLCAASVADQGVPVEHLVQDGGSTDGTAAWCAGRPEIAFRQAPDAGMYDAVNRGLDRAGGEFCAYLNCDEQYLPGALARVAEEFRRHPEAEVIFADAVVVWPDGAFLARRQALLPQALHTRLSGNLAVLTCATFFRREVFARRGIRFDAQWRTLGDGIWVLRLLAAGVRLRVLRHTTSAFTETGVNLGAGAANVAEAARLRATVPAPLRALTPLVVAHYRLRKLLHGLYRPGPLAYDVYTPASPGRRRRFEVARAGSRWRR
jgi:glycosyltransferase involved in cell wall biosynthesis